MKRKVTKKIIIHHTAGHLTDTLGMVKQWHKDKGFTDKNGCSGYHYFIDKNGYVQPDRPLEDWGCAVKNANQDCVHICLAGNFDKELPPQAQIDGLKEILARIVRKFDLKYWNIYGHKDIKKFFIFNTTSTNCPGNNLYKKLPAIRNWVGMVLEQINGETRK